MSLNWLQTPHWGLALLHWLPLPLQLTSGRSVLDAPAGQSQCVAPYGLPVRNDSLSSFWLPSGLPAQGPGPAMPQAQQLLCHACACQQPCCHPQKQPGLLRAPGLRCLGLRLHRSCSYFATLVFGGRLAASLGSSLAVLRAPGLRCLRLRICSSCSCSAMLALTGSFAATLKSSPALLGLAFCGCMAHWLLCGACRQYPEH